MHYGHNGAQCLRDRSNSQCHCKHHRVQQRHPAIDTQAEYDSTYEHDQYGKSAAELVQAFLQRCLALFGCIHQSCNLTQLRLHAGSSHQHLGASVGNQTSGIDHICPVSKRHITLYNGICFLYVGRLACQRAFIDLQRIAVQDTAIGHDHVARFQYDNVTRHNILRWNFQFHTVSNDFCTGRR